MPTYSYACTECGHAFDIYQSFSDDALTVCPECAGALRKKFNSVGVVFKGSGFYRTDSRNDAKHRSSSSSSQGSTGGSSDSSDSTSGATSSSKAATGKASSTSSAPASSGASKS